MKSILRAVRWFLFLAVLIAVVWVVLANYSFVFSKKIKGQVIDVERVVEPTALLGRGLPAEQVFSYAIVLRAEDGTIYSSSSEDRQWAIAKKGYCVETRIYPYPPWDLEKANTYHNARLLKILDCEQLKLKEGALPHITDPTATPTPVESAPQ